MRMINLFILLTVSSIYVSGTHDVSSMMFHNSRVKRKLKDDDLKTSGENKVVYNDQHCPSANSYSYRSFNELTNMAFHKLLELTIDALSTYEINNKMNEDVLNQLISKVGSKMEEFIYHNYHEITIEKDYQAGTKQEAELKSKTYAKLFSITLKEAIGKCKNVLEAGTFIQHYDDDNHKPLKEWLDILPSIGNFFGTNLFIKLNEKIAHDMRYSMNVPPQSKGNVLACILNSFNTELIKKEFPCSSMKSTFLYSGYSFKTRMGDSVIIYCKQGKNVDAIKDVLVSCLANENEEKEEEKVKIMERISNRLYIADEIDGVSFGGARSIAVETAVKGMVKTFITTNQDVRKPITWGNFKEKINLSLIHFGIDPCNPNKSLPPQKKYIKIFKRIHKK